MCVCVCMCVCTRVCVCVHVCVMWAQAGIGPVNVYVCLVPWLNWHIVLRICFWPVYR